MQEIQNCENCNQIFEKPQSLSCGDTLCLNCVNNEKIKLGSGKNEWNCPLCKEVVTVHFLNKKLNSIVEDFKKKQCKVHKKQQIIALCQSCSCLVCKECTTGYSHRGHIFGTITEDQFNEIYKQFGREQYKSLIHYKKDILERKEKVLGNFNQIKQDSLAQLQLLDSTFTLLIQNLKSTQDEIQESINKTMEINQLSFTKVTNLVDDVEQFLNSIIERNEKYFNSDLFNNSIGIDNGSGSNDSGSGDETSNTLELDNEIKRLFENESYITIIDDFTETNNLLKYKSNINPDDFIKSNLLINNDQINLLRETIKSIFVFKKQLPQPLPSLNRHTTIAIGSSNASSSNSLSPRGNSLSPRGNSLSPRGNSLSPRDSSLSPRGSNINDKIFNRNCGSVIIPKSSSIQNINSIDNSLEQNNQSLGSLKPLNKSSSANNLLKSIASSPPPPKVEINNNNHNNNSNSNNVIRKSESFTSASSLSSLSLNNSKSSIKKSISNNSISSNGSSEEIANVIHSLPTINGPVQPVIVAPSTNIDTKASLEIINKANQKDQSLENLIFRWNVVDPIPENTTSVCVISTQKVIQVGQLPSSVTSLMFSGYNQPIIEGSLGNSILSLHLGHDFNIPLQPNCIPSSVTTLNLGNKYNKPLLPNSIPSSITELNLGESYNSPLVVGSIPSSVITLVMGGQFNQKINQPNILPSSIVCLKFSHEFNQPLNFGIIPNSVKVLEFGYSFNQVLAPSVLPPGLTSLTFGYMYNQSLAPLVLPPGLTSLTFGYFFNQPIKSSNIIPASIQNISFGSGFKQTLTKYMFPKQIKSILLPDHYIGSKEISSVVPSTAVVSYKPKDF